MDDILIEPAYEYKGCYICKDCVREKGIKKYIERHSVHGNICKICGSSLQSADLYDVLTFIQKRIELEYEKADTALYYDGEEGEYMGCTMDTESLIESLFEKEMDEFKEILIKVLGENEWCDLTTTWDNIYRPMSFAWDVLKTEILTNRRYTFLLKPFDFFPSEKNLTGKDILEDIQYFIKNNNLLKTIDKGTIFLRGRGKEFSKNDSKIEEKHFTEVKDLCSPPCECALEGRMNPKGISMFYCAEEEKTIIKEIGRPKYCNITIAAFECLQNLNVLDLGEVPEIPSLFDENIENRMAFMFLNEFKNDISKMTFPEDKIHPEYILSQVVTEYFRYYLKTEKNENVHGIRYKSSVADGYNFVFFCSPCAFEGDSSCQEKYFKLLPEKTHSIYLKALSKCQ